MSDEAIRASIEQINARLSRIEALSSGARAVYVGNGRLMTRANINDMQIIYLVEADDKLIVPHFIMDGYFEPEVTRYLAGAVRETDHCLDVGANFGYYSCIMGKLAWRGKTLAVEPDRRIFELLRDNIFINWMEQGVTPIHGAVADRDGILKLNRRISRSGNTSIIKLPDEALARLGEPPSEAFDVRSVKIDSLLPDFGGRIDVMKIDIEGAEPLAFRGVGETLAANPNIRIVMEWAPAQIREAGFDVGQFLKDLSALGLKPYIIGHRGAAGATWDEILHVGYLNGLLLHK